MSIDKVLGKITEYPQTYDPSILVREDRQTNRSTVGLDGSDLPFVGYDVWNAYEVSSLTNAGMPVVGVCKIRYNCNSKYIVESKSIKLYFNSFNMDRIGETTQDVISELSRRATNDLSELLETDVEISFFPGGTKPENTSPVFNDDYKNLESMVGDLDIHEYQENHYLLNEGTEHRGIDKTVKYHSALLKSNCKVTSQPDWGDVYIHMKGKEVPSAVNFMKYIVSFRDECHFHEEICETMYKRLSLYNPTELVVTCLYARRGGIDINPTRASNERLLPSRLISLNEPHVKTDKQ